MKLSESFYKKRMKQQNGCCFYCGCPLIIGYGGNVNIDHILPFSKYRDGRRGNLCLSCKSCNTVKLDLVVEDFRKKCIKNNIILINDEFYYERENIDIWP